jgi:hypothetical protein
MRLTIRAQQMSEIEQGTQEKFVQRLARHLLADYPKSVVILPSAEKFTIDTLPKETLAELVRVAVVRARQFRMVFESSIAAFTAIMFETAPNFYKHTLCQVILNDDLEPDAQIEMLLSVLNEKTVKTIQERYDPLAWNLAEENSELTPEAEAEPPTKQREFNEYDFMDTIKN